MPTLLTSTLRTGEVGLGGSGPRLAAERAQHLIGCGNAAQIGAVDSCVMLD
jgi:hypothetical protein